MILKYDKILFLGLAAILVALFAQCVGKMATSESVAPVYVGDVQTQDCRRVGPCQEFVLDNGFRFSIWWGNDQLSLNIGIDNKHLVKGTTEVWMKYAEVVVVTPEGESNHKNEKVRIFGNDLKEYSGLYTTNSGIYTHKLIDDDVTYRVKIDFEIRKGEESEFQSFEGEFKKGVLTSSYPLV